MAEKESVMWIDRSKETSDIKWKRKREWITTATLQELGNNFQYQTKTYKQNKNTTKEHIWM